jgi:hypothetical protein
MNKDSIIILLAILIFVNFIVLILLGRSGKKSPKAPKKKDDNMSTYDINESEGKTEITGRPRERSDSEQGGIGRPSFDKIPELSDSAKKAIINETIIGDQASQGDNSTEIMSAEEEIYGVLSFKDKEETQYEMKKKEIFIGRDPEQCDLVISSDRFLGRKHARLYVDNGRFFVEDLKTRNGTYVEGNKISGICEVASKKFKAAGTDIIIK